MERAFFFAWTASDTNGGQRYGNGSMIINGALDIPFLQKQIEATRPNIMPGSVILTNLTPILVSDVQAQASNPGTYLSKHGYDEKGNEVEL